MKKKYGIIFVIIISVVLITIFITTRIQKQESPNNVTQEAVGGSGIIDEAGIDENDSSYIE